MKKLRPFLALLLACRLLAVPALADGKADGAPDNALSASDGASGDTPASEDSGPSGSEEAPSPEEDPPTPENPEETPPLDTPLDTEDPSEGAPPVVDNTPDTPDLAPVDPEPEPVPEPPGPADPPYEALQPETPADPLPELPVPDSPANPVPDIPPSDIASEAPPIYAVSDTPLTPGAVAGDGIGEAPMENHQVFTLTTIPEFACALMDADADNTLSQVVRDLFGTYTPRVQVVSTYVDGEVVSTEEQYVPGVAGMDWEWITGAAVFLLMLYCLFRLLGGAVKYG